MQTATVHGIVHTWCTPNLSANKDDDFADGFGPLKIDGDLSAPDKLCPRTGGYEIGGDDTESCSYERERLDNVEECRSAAAALGKTFGFAGSYSGWPLYCFMYRDVAWLLPWRLGILWFLWAPETWEIKTLKLATMWYLDTAGPYTTSKQAYIFFPSYFFQRKWWHGFKFQSVFSKIHLSRLPSWSTSMKTWWTTTAGWVLGSSANVLSRPPPPPPAAPVQLGPPEMGGTPRIQNWVLSQLKLAIWRKLQFAISKLKMCHFSNG